MSKNEIETDARPPRERHLFMLALSLIVIAIVLLASYYHGKELFDVSSTEAARSSYLFPYLINLGGVLLFIMNTSRRKQKNWRLRDFWGDHVYRVAQSVAYLFIVMWAWPSPDTATTAVTAQVPPNILGFLVGLFILRVERAMEGLGDKFEQILMTILPRAVQYVTAEERKRQQLRTVYKIDEIATEYQVLRTKITDPAARKKLDALIDKAMAASNADDTETTKKAADELLRAFGEAKEGIGEILIPVEDLLRTGSRGPRPSG